MGWYDFVRLPFAFQVAGKREPEQEREAQEWIEQVVGERFPPGYLYEDVLRDGIILCKLMNRLQPGIITKINYSGGDYKFMDNLNQYVYYHFCNTGTFNTTHEVLYGSLSNAYELSSHFFYSSFITNYNKWTQNFQY